MKKAISMMLVLVLCLCLCACGNSAEPQQTTAAPQPTVSVETMAPATEAPEQTVPAVEVVDLTIGSVMSTDFVEMTFEEVVIAEDIKYSVTTGVVTRITGPDPVAGQQYICISGKIKNTSTSPLPVYDFFLGNFNLDGYNYTVDANDCDILDAEGSSEYEIAPLMEYTFRIYVALPESLATSHSSCVFTFGFYDLFDNQELSYNRAFAEDPIAVCPYQFALTIK